MRYYYISKNILVEEDEGLGLILKFRNGTPDKKEIDRVLKLCGFKIKEVKRKYLKLEVANA